MIPARSVHISVDVELLRQIDEDPETRESGRSAFLRSGAWFYLAAKRRSAIDQEIARAYWGEADAMLREVARLLAHRVLFPKSRPRRRTTAAMKDGIRRHVRKRHARR